MKLLSGISLIVAATVFLTFALVALTVAMPQTFNDRALFLLALSIAGVVLGTIGIKDLRRVSRAHA